MSAQELAERLRSRRNELAISQKRVADLAGVTSRLLIQWESGHGNPSFRQLNSVLDVLGLALTIGQRQTDEKASSGVQ